MELVGIAFDVVPLIKDILDTVRTIISNSFPVESACISQTKLYVEWARLGEFAHILLLVIESSPGTALNLANLQRNMTNAQQNLVETQRSIHIYDFVRAAGSEPDMSHVSGLIQNLTKLNNSLYQDIKIYNTHNRRAAHAISELSDQRSIHGSRLSTGSLVYNLWSSSVQALQTFGHTNSKDLSLQRTFQRAAVRLDIWQDGFDFDLSQIEQVLETNEYLYEAIVVALARLVYLLYT